MKGLRYLIGILLVVVICAGLTGCGEKYVDLPEEICHEWLLVQDIEKSMEIGFFNELLDDFVSYAGGYDQIDEVRLKIIPAASVYSVKYVGDANVVKNSINIKYTGEEIVFLQNKDEIGRCKYEIIDNELLLLTFNENGVEQSVGFLNTSAFE